MLTRTLVELADNLVDDFDIVELLTRLTDRCVDIFDIAAAGIMLVAPDGDLRLMSSSSEALRTVELFELQSQEGPCLDCYRTGEPVITADLAADASRWPRFTPIALGAGFHGVDALPMRLRREVIGALNIFHTDPSSLDADELLGAKALADIATIAILQHDAAVNAQALNEQLSQALKSRILIEQAKGVIGERMGLDMATSFSLLRNHARNHNLRLADVAADVVDGTLGPNDLDRPRPERRPPAITPSGEWG
jgi:GAF domain-containing protein